ncbi:CLIP domain-containing serine protease B9-like [Hetaerina americana]|uniref:CLIP domain-containing serine protease B9-like n=1 Tax=Hetaerina americana TaxID=62018 RepID=UPI003A7F4FC1
MLLILDGSPEPCVTPDRRGGECVELRRCPYLLGPLTNNSHPSESLLRVLRSKCRDGSLEPLVCCPSAAGGAAPSVQPPEAGGGEVSGGGGEKEVKGKGKWTVRFHRNVGLLRRDICGPLALDDVEDFFQLKLYRFPWMALISFEYATAKFVLRPTTADQKQHRVQACQELLNRAEEDENLFPKVTTGDNIADSNKRQQVISRQTKVRIGEHDTMKDDDCGVVSDNFNRIIFPEAHFWDEEICAPSPEDIPIEEIIIHPDLSRETPQNDIALVRLEKPLNFRDCYNIWSNTGIVVEPGACKSVKNVTDSKQFCMDESFSLFYCNMLRGEPAMRVQMFRGSLKYVQLGVSAFPGNCRDRNSIYTRVEPFMVWILDNMRP